MLPLWPSPSTTGQRKGEARCRSNQVLVGGLPMDRSLYRYVLCLFVRLFERNTTRGLETRGRPLKSIYRTVGPVLCQPFFDPGQVSEGLTLDTLVKRLDCFVYTRGRGVKDLVWFYFEPYTHVFARGRVRAASDGHRSVGNRIRSSEASFRPWQCRFNNWLVLKPCIDAENPCLQLTCSSD